jgi:hypothetical protein
MPGRQQPLGCGSPSWPEFVDLSSYGFWTKYYQHGRPVRESTGTKNEVVARLTVLKRMFRLAIEAGKLHSQTARCHASRGQRSRWLL